MFPGVQLELTQAPAPDFDGETYSHDRDHERLARQQSAVFETMLAGRWLTLKELALLAGAPEASVSARLRDLRKSRFGGHVVERRYVRKGLYEYRLVINPNTYTEE